MVNTRRVAAALLPLVTPVLIALWCSSGPQTAYAATQVPFEAHFSGAMHLSNSPGGFPVNVGGIGDASYLGHSSNSAHVIQLNEANSSCPATGFVVLNTGILRSTQDNNDQIYVAITDHPCPVAGRPNVYSGTDSYTVTGGTGRFAGATGGGSFTGTGNFNNLTFTYTFSGTITAPNDNY